MKRDLRFDRLSATLHVANATMTTSDLVAVTGELTIAASGTLRFDQSLDLTGTARYTRAASDDLVRRVKDLGGLGISAGFNKGQTKVIVWPGDIGTLFRSIPP